MEKLDALSEKYVLLDSLLFRTYPEKETAVLAIPEMCTDKIITLYHKSLFAGHQGVIKTYLTISDKFFIPNSIHYIIYERLSHMSIIKNQSKLCINVKTEYGFESHAQDCTEATNIFCASLMK